MSIAETPTSTTYSQSTFATNKSTLWHRSAPKSVVGAYEAGDEDAGWVEWTKHLKKRPPTAFADESTDAKDCWLLWATTASCDRDNVADIVSVLAVASRNGKSREVQIVERLERWLDQSSSVAGETAALINLAWARSLPRLSRILPAGLWWALVEQLIAISRDASAIDLARQPLEHQLLAGELPLTLSHVLPEVKACRELGDAARDQISRGLVDLHDGEGLLHATNLGYSDRCSRVGRAVERLVANESAARGTRKATRSTTGPFARRCV